MVMICVLHKPLPLLYPLPPHGEDGQLVSWHRGISTDGPRRTLACLCTNGHIAHFNELGILMNWPINQNSTAVLRSLIGRRVPHACRKSCPWGVATCQPSQFSAVIGRPGNRLQGRLITLTALRWVGNSSSYHGLLTPGKLNTHLA